MTRPRLELAINAKDGIFIRSIPESTPLPQADTHGYSAEAAVVNAMSRWGLPDFAFPSSTMTVGSGTREIGDGLLLTYPLAAVIQVKARLSVSQEESRERGWLDKNIAKADRQVWGTLRNLNSGVKTLANMRGATIPIVATEHEWLGIVIVEHEAIPEGYTPRGLTQRGVILTRADWEFLWAQLQSTVEVLRYIYRIGDLDPVPLGDEAFRYYDVALLDDEREMEPLPAAWVALGGTRVNGPLLPLAPAGQVVEHYVIRQIMEDLARGDIPPDIDFKKLLRAFSALDGINVAQRDQMGSDLLENLLAGFDNPQANRSWSRRILSPIPNSPQILLMTDSHSDDAYSKMLLTAKVELAHDDWLRSEVHNSSNLTVGVLLTPSTSPPRLWDATMVALDTLTLLSEEERALRLEITS